MFFHRIHPFPVPNPDFFRLADEQIQMALKKIKLGLQLSGKPFIIRIQKSNIRGLAVLNAKITRCRGALVGLKKIPEVWFFARQFFNHRSSPVARTVIYYENLKRRVSLSQDGLNCPSE